MFVLFKLTPFNYDLISIRETNLNYSVDIPDHLHRPGNESHGGVMYFYKIFLPFIPKEDLSFVECIVIELKFGQNKYFSLYYIAVLRPSIPLQNCRILYSTHPGLPTMLKRKNKLFKNCKKHRYQEEDKVKLETFSHWMSIGSWNCRTMLPD